MIKKGLWYELQNPIYILLIEDGPDDELLLKEALTEFSAQSFLVAHAGRLDTGRNLLAKGRDNNGQHN